MHDERRISLSVPADLSPWLAAFITEALRETDTLRDNGADAAVAARDALLRKLVTAASTFLDATIDTHQAARELGRSEETVRRAVRAGTLPDHRANPRGRHRVRRGDLQMLVTARTGSYDASADAQDIARLRREP